MNRLKIDFVGLAVLVVALGGCGGKSATDRPTGVGRTAFERSDDPAIMADTYFAAGQLAESQGLGAKAIEQYRSALGLDPRHQASLYRTAVVRTQLRQFPEAIAAWEAYLKETGYGATGYSNLGFCYELAGRAEEAERAYKQGVANEPANVACRTNYGLMLARLGRRNEAIVQLQAVLPDAQVHYNLGSVHESLGQAEQAKAEYAKALSLDPGLREAREKLAGLD